jgi:hypothetical protein
MVDVVYSVPSYVALEAVATQLGFMVTSKGQTMIKTAGFLADGGGYMLNHVGTVMVPTGNTVEDVFGNFVPETAPLPGEWGRLRLNGQSDFISSIPPEAPITVYHLDDPMVPSYVHDIGVIA